MIPLPPKAPSCPKAKSPHERSGPTNEDRRPSPPAPIIDRIVPRKRSRRTRRRRTRRRRRRKGRGVAPPLLRVRDDGGLFRGGVRDDRPEPPRPPPPPSVVVVVVVVVFVRPPGRGLHRDRAPPDPDYRHDYCRDDCGGWWRWRWGQHHDGRPLDALHPQRALQVFR